MSSLRAKLVAALLYLPPPVVVGGRTHDVAAIGHVGRGEKKISSITYAYVCQMREDMSMPALRRSPEQVRLWNQKCTRRPPRTFIGYKAAGFLV